VAIIDGNLTPLNPNEPLVSQIFVYNHIFFSFAVDTPLSFRDNSSAENNPSFTQANQDIIGLKSLNLLEIDGLHILATCVTHYKGHRVTSQSIIPGILNNNDLASLAEYGIVDEKKEHIKSNEEFHKLM
jgi:protein TIF31